MGVLKKAIYKAERGGHWALQGHDSNIVLKYDKGDYLAKVRILPEIDATLQFVFPQKPKEELIMAKTIVLPRNSEADGINRRNYLSLVTDISGPASRRIHRYTMSVETLEMMNASAKDHVKGAADPLSDTVVEDQVPVAQSTVFVALIDDA